MEVSCCVGEGVEGEQQGGGQYRAALARLTPDILSSSLPVPLVQLEQDVPGLPSDQSPAAQLPLPAELCTLGRVLG